MVDGEKKKRRPWPLIRRFWGFARPHRRYVIVAGSLMALSAPISLVSPLIIKRVVDDAVEKGAHDDVLLWGGALVALTGLSVLFGLGIGWCNTLFHAKVIRDLRLRLYIWMQHLSYRYHTDHETGWLMSRQVDDVGSLDGVMADRLTRAAIDFARAIGYVVMIFVVEWRLATGGLALVLLVFGFEYAISGRLRSLAKTSRERWTDVSSALHQGISGHQLVRTTASEKRESRRFAETLHDSVRAEVRHGKFRLISNHVFSLIGGVAPTLIILAGVYLIVQSDFTVGGLFAFFMYLTGMFGAVGSVVTLNPQVQASLAALERIFEVLDTEPEIATPNDGQESAAITGQVTFENVTFAYEEGRPVLRGIDLEIPARTRVALVGPSGSGKTTLAHLVPRLLDPTEGVIRVDGTDLRAFQLPRYREHVGLVPQEVFLFDRSVADNIAYGTRGATTEEIRAAARAANALAFIEDLPEGLETQIGERGAKLSGGQRQRLAIAREILRSPRILILDEATSSLDSETEALIQEALDRLLCGRTSIVIAHRLSTIVGSDLILVVDGGRIVERGNHEELLREDGLYARLYRSQFHRAGSPGRFTDP